MTDEAMVNRADKAFWEDEYLADVGIPSYPDDRMPFERCLAAELAVRAPVRSHARVLELGCAPGTWLAFYAKQFGADVAGIEYTGRGAELTRTNFAAQGIAGRVIEADVFTLDARPFDLVLSLGFIEHFDDLDAAFDRHVDFVAPHGRLVIGVPNYRGLNRLMQRWSDPGHLALHNLEAMQPERYRDLASRHGLCIDHMLHIGGPDPIIIKVGRRSVLPMILAEARLRRLRLTDAWNHAWFSSYFLVVLSRQALRDRRR